MTDPTNNRPDSNASADDPFSEEESTAADNRPTPPSTSTDRIIKGSASIGIINFFTFASAFMWRPVIAAFLGTGPRADAFNFAVLLMNRIYRSWEALIVPAFLPTLSSVRAEKGEKSAWRFASSILSLQFLILAALAAVGIVRPQVWTALVAGEEFPQDETMRLIRWMSIALLFLGLSTTTYQILNSYKRFTFAHLGELTNKLGQVLGLILFYRWLGVPGLALAFVLGAIFRPGIHLVGLGRMLKNIRPAADWNSPAMRKLAVLTLPLLVGVVFAFFRDIVEYRMRSDFAGAMSIVTYGRTLGDVAVQIIPFAMGVALFPFISDYAARKEDKRLFGLLWSSMRFVLVIFLPVSAFMIVFRVPLIQFVFERGEFADDPRNLQVTANTSAWYALGLVGFAAEIILARFFFAKKNTVIPTVLGIVTSLLLLALMYYGTRMMLEPEYGFTMAHTVAKSLKSLVMVGLLVLIFPAIGLWGHELGRTLWSLLKIALAVAAACAASLAVATLVMQASPWAIAIEEAPIPYLFDSTAKTMLVKLVCLLAIGLPGFVAYAAALAALRVEEFQLAWEFVRSKAIKRR